MKNALDLFSAVTMGWLAIYCSVAFWFHWPLSNVVWWGCSCGFAWAALDRFGRLSS